MLNAAVCQQAAPSDCANLVVNTDADQIFIAESGPHQIGGLPPITYQRVE
jgi:hypothetical protein